MKHFETFTHRKMNWDDHCKAYPSETLHLDNGVYIQKSFIPYCHETTKIVYFVDGENGDSYGQFETISKAYEKYDKMRKLELSERRSYDE